MIPRCLPILILAAAVASAADVEIALTSGRTVRGQLVSDGDAIVLRLRQPVRGGIKEIDATYQRSDIMRRKDLPSVEQQYDERLKSSRETVPDLCVLAQWCYENCLRERARDHAAKVLELDADNTWAKHILDNAGFILIDGKWVDEEQYLKQTNQEKYSGQIMPVALAEARRALDRALTVRDVAAKRLATLQAILKDKPTMVAGNDAKVKDQQAAADAARKTYDELKKKYDEMGNAPLAKNDTPDKRQKRLADMQTQIGKQVDKVNETKKSLDAATHQQASDKGQLDRATAQVADAQAAVDKANADVKAAAAKLPADDPAAQAALASIDAKPDPKPDDGKTATGAKPAVDAPKEPVRRLGHSGD